MIRSCVACRQRKAATELVRLALNPEQHLCITTHKPPGQRSAWVCVQHKCIVALCKKPALAARALKTRPLGCCDLLQETKQIYLRRIQHLLSLCHQSGVITSGKAKNLRFLQKIKLLLLANPEKQRYWSKQAPNIPIYCLTTSTGEMGRWINRGPRQVLGILPNRHLDTLNENLRLWGKLS